MKRLLIIPLAVGALLGAAVGVTSAASGTTPARYGKAKVASCHPALASNARLLKLWANVRAVRGTRLMGVRFDLFSRGPGQGAYRHRTDLGHDLSIWHYSSGPVGSFIYTLSVTNLDAPAQYRTRVAFRWYGAHHRLLGARAKWLATCDQPDMRPNLRVRAIFARPVFRPNGKADPTESRYAVQVRNAGRSAAGAFQVTLAFPDGTSHTWSLNGLGPNTTRTLSPAFKGPACAAGPPTATVDPGNAVAESNETDNTRAATCQ